MTYVKSTNDSELTKVQEHLIFALWMLEGNLYGRAGGDYIPQYFSGSAIALVNGGQWSTYRARMTKDLITRGWVETHKQGRLRYYRLSDTGYQWVDNLLFQARNGRTYQVKQAGASLFDSPPAKPEKKAKPKPLKVKGKQVAWFNLETMQFEPMESK
jgi:hypothetical protein